MSDLRRFERRWANRRITGDPSVAPPAPTELPTAAMRLLPDYEDAIYSAARHSLQPADMKRWNENAHMVEAVRLHGEVRRLRMEVHSLIETQAPYDE